MRPGQDVMGPSAPTRTAATETATETANETDNHDETHDAKR